MFGMNDSLYIHIPFCQSKCWYCGFYSEPMCEAQMDNYIDALLKELGERVDNEHWFRTIYIGGGSPSALGSERLSGLIERVMKNRKKPMEFTVEVNPAQADFEMLSRLKTSGVNRLSIGVQSFIDEELKFLGRKYNVNDVYSLIKTAKNAGIRNMSIDLMFAIPGSDLEKWQYNIDQAIMVNVQHVSAYSLTYETDTPMTNALIKGEITSIDEDTDANMFQLSMDCFNNAGIKQYEISNYARSGFESQHNIAYWKRLPCLGIGASAGSLWDGIRTDNISNITEYINRINHSKKPVSEETEYSEIEAVREKSALLLRMNEGINIKEFINETGFDPVMMYGRELQENIKYGLLEKNENTIRLTEKGIYLANSVMADFI